MLVMTRMAKNVPYNPPDWSTATDAEIVEALRRHYDPDDPLDLTEIWSVGDERVVSLSAMPSTYVSESHVAQDVILVLMNKGGKTLTTPIGEHTECAFVVGQKNVFSNTQGDSHNYERTEERGVIYANSNDLWYDSARRSWCNEIYYNAIPSSLKPIFKQFKNYFNNLSEPYNVTDDYFALPSGTEVLGTNSYSESSAESSDRQFEYYEISSNKCKRIGNAPWGTNGEAYWETIWGTRSKRRDNNAVVVIDINGNGGTNVTYNSPRPLAPFGVI